MNNSELLHALHSLKEDAAHAWMRLLEGDEAPLAEVGKSMKQVEAIVIKRDVERRAARERV